MKGRLSYANVMATLAFFFALAGGAAAAGAKYLTGSDAIPVKSDVTGIYSDLTGTYGNPLIGDGKVTTPKLADGAVTSAKFDPLATTPNSNRLNGKDSTACPNIVARGETPSVYAGDVFNPGVCATEGVRVVAADPATDLVL